MIGNRLALLCLVLVLLSVASSLDLEHAKQKPSGSSALSPGPKPNGLDKLKGIFTKAVDKGKQIIAGIRAAIKKDIDEVKLWWKKKFADIKQLYQYSRHCLNEKAPKSLKIKVQNSALCATVRKAHPKFTAFLDKIVDKLPEPSLDETMNAELEGEAQRKHSLIELDASQSVPGDDTRKWPSTLISYALSPNLDPRAVVSFQWGINHIESVTCIRFQQVDINSNHTQGVMRVWPDTGAFVSACAAELGFRGAAGNNVWWASTCSAGTAAHEILHALGFHHTMARLDRDEYITVNLTRILPKAHSNFAKTTSPFKDYGPYDFKSILHYAASAGGVKAFPGMAEKLNRPASVPAALNSPWDGEAQRDALSPGDIDAVKKMYCPNGSGAGSATGSGLASGSGSGSV